MGRTCGDPTHADVIVITVARSRKFKVMIMITTNAHLIFMIIDI